MLNRRQFLALPLALPVLDLQAATGLNEQQWQLIAGVQAHLLPSEPQAPGAAEIRASYYLQQHLRHAPADQALIRRGIPELCQLCLEHYQKKFIQLNESQRETVLRLYEQEGGRDWLHRLLYLTLEACLSDPVYGGNPDGIGWRWLDHHPGYQRPPKHRLYFDYERI